MPLLRASNTSFEEVYATIGGNGTGPLDKRCALMLNFISIIDELFPETEIWGLASHENILILDEKDKHKVIARISTEELAKYKIEYGENFIELYPNNKYFTILIEDKQSIEQAFLKIFKG